MLPLIVLLYHMLAKHIREIEIFLRNVALVNHSQLENLLKQISLNLQTSLCGTSTMESPPHRPPWPR